MWGPGELSGNLHQIIAEPKAKMLMNSLLSMIDMILGSDHLEPALTCELQCHVLTHDGLSLCRVFLIQSSTSSAYKIAAIFDNRIQVR